MQFDYKIMLQKGIKYFVAFVLPFAVSQFIFQMPEIANLTIGSCLLMLVNALKTKYDIRQIP